MEYLLKKFKTVIAILTKWQKAYVLLMKTNISSN